MTGLASILMFMLIFPCIYGEKITETQIQNLLKRLNKQAVKSIKSEDGDIIDCVNSHTIQMRPSFIPKGDHYTNTSKDAKAITQVWHKSGKCPENTVAIRRTTREEILRAESIERFGKKPLQYKRGPGVNEHAAMRVKRGRYYGTQFALNVWKPNVETSDEFSLAQTWLDAGAGKDFNSIEAGWQVCRRRFEDNNPRLFVYWTANGYQKGQPGEGCYNLDCPGFRQLSNHHTLGTAFDPSQYGGNQRYLAIQIWKSDGHWWLKVENEIVGYWNGTLFNSLRYEASEVIWGGEVINEKTGGRHKWKRTFCRGRVSESKLCPQCYDIRWRPYNEGTTRTYPYGY